MSDVNHSPRRPHPAWFYDLSPREQAKQIRRWRYYRRYYRGKWGPEWARIHACIAVVRGVQRAGTP